MLKILKAGDIVAHRSDREIAGAIRGRNACGEYEIDYSIAMPPTLAKRHELIVIRAFSADKDQYELELDSE